MKRGKRITKSLKNKSRLIKREMRRNW